MLYIPAREMFDRHAAHGLTRYGYDEVVDAAADAERAKAEYEAACLRAWTVMGMNVDYYMFVNPATGSLSGPVYNETGAALEAVVVECQDKTPDLQAGSYSNEMFPVAKWQAAAKRYRTLARRVVKAVDAAIAH